VLGGTEHQVGIVYSVAPVFELPFMYYFGLQATRGDQSRLIRTGVVLAAVYYAALGLVREPWHVYLVQILSAAVTAIIAGVALTFFQNFLPDQPGTATNLYVSAQRLGSTIGYLVFGALVASLGHRAVFVVCTGLCGAAWLLLAASRREPAPEAAAASAPAGTAG